MPNKLFLHPWFDATVIWQPVNQRFCNQPNLTPVNQSGLSLSSVQRREIQFGAAHNMVRVNFKPTASRSCPMHSIFNPQLARQFRAMIENLSATSQSLQESSSLITHLEWTVENFRTYSAMHTTNRRGLSGPFVTMSYSEIRHDNSTQKVTTMPWLAWICSYLIGLSAMPCLCSTTAFCSRRPQF